MSGDVGRYRSSVDIDRASGTVKLTIATQDSQLGAGNARATRVLRCWPSPPNGAAAAEHVDLLAVSVEVSRSREADTPWPPHDYGQGSTILIDRDQAVDLRALLDEFITQAVTKLPSEIAAERAAAAVAARAAEIAETVRSTGDPFGRNP